MAFEGVLSQPGARPSRWLRIAITASLLLHVLMLAAATVHSVWQVEEMPLPAIHVTLAAEAPPPPPPPPPKRRATKTKRTKRVQSKVHALTTPPVDPEEPNKPEEEVEEDEGEEGGVVGGVAGGVVGGVPVPDPPPPPKPKPKPKPKRPKMVSARVARGQLLSNPSLPRNRVKLPRALEKTGETYSATLLVCVSAKGRVTGVRVLKSAGPAIDPQFPTVIGSWRYRPLRINGKPAPFCYHLRYQIATR